MAKINNKNRKFVECCIKVASNGHMTSLHGAALVSKTGKIISVGYNKHFPDESNTDCKIRSYSNMRSIRRVRSIHAEIAACRKIPNRILRESILYVIRITRSGELRPSKPCKACHKYIEKKRILNVYYS